MARILVAGGLMQQGEENSETSAARRLFAAEIGRQIISRGHVVLGGCRTGLDAEVAVAAGKEAVATKKAPKQVIRSWVTSSTKPSHDIGEIIRSKMIDWGRVPRGLAFPEPVQEADVVIIVGGWDGTHYAASWARLANKPLVPVAAFGLAAAEIYEDEMRSFERRYGARLSVDEFEILNRLLQNYDDATVSEFAKEVVSLAERLILPTRAFVIMSFAEDGHLIDAFNTFERVCREYGFTAYKVDQHLDNQLRIVPNIFSAIRHSAFIIAEVSGARPNVYYELGFAQALGKEIITTAYKGTELPFDIFDVPVHFWDSQHALEKKLRSTLDTLATKLGRQAPVARS